jgi:GH25 family lysozyme M1 (1,4-beta-N-acetylmuramidase)
MIMTRAKLFDISTFQESPKIPGEIDYDILAFKTDGGFIRMMSGKDFDDDFKKNYAGLKDKTILSSYTWGKWKEYAKPQAIEVCEALKDYPVDFPHALDFEKYLDGTPLPTPYNIVQWILDWGDVYKHYFDHTPILYINGEISLMIQRSKHPRLNELKEWPLWISYPGSESIIYSKGYLGIWNMWTFWQYSWTGDPPFSNNGRDFGVESYGLDLNYFNGTVNDFKKWAFQPCENIPEPTPTPEPPPTSVILPTLKVVSPVRVRELPNNYYNTAVLRMRQIGEVVKVEDLHVNGSGSVWAKDKDGWSAIVHAGWQYME